MPEISDSPGYVRDCRQNLLSGSQYKSPKQDRFALSTYIGGESVEEGAILSVLETLIKLLLPKNTFAALLYQAFI